MWIGKSQKLLRTLKKMYKLPFHYRKKSNFSMLFKFILSLLSNFSNRKGKSIFSDSLIGYVFIYNDNDIFQENRRETYVKLIWELFTTAYTKQIKNIKTIVQDTNIFLMCANLVIMFTIELCNVNKIISEIIIFL